MESQETPVSCDLFFTPITNYDKLLRSFTFNVITFTEKNMNKIYFLLLVFLVCSNILAQDTLRCDVDLVWNKTEKAYYLKNSNPLKLYTGPATCKPRKDYINKGFIKDGAWEGKVYGYKLGKPLGYVTFQKGIRNGAEVRFDEKGNKTDSSFYKDGGPLYVSEFSYDKHNYLTFIYKKDYIKDTSILIQYSFDFETNTPYVVSLERRKGKKKDGNQDEFENAYDENGVYSLLTQRNFYVEGELVRKYYYEEGQLVEEKVYEYGNHTYTLNYFNGKLVEKVPYKNGKKDGSLITYGENGEVMMEILYSKGKMIKVLD